MAKANEDKGKLVHVPARVSAPVAEEKIRFLEWFATSLNRFQGLKPHHLTAVRAYFIGISIPDPAAPSAYEEGMNKFGLKRAD